MAINIYENMLYRAMNYNINDEIYKRRKNYNAVMTMIKNSGIPLEELSPIPEAIEKYYHETFKFLEEIRSNISKSKDINNYNDRNTSFKLEKKRFYDYLYYNVDYFQFLDKETFVDTYKEIKKKEYIPNIFL